LYSTRAANELKAPYKKVEFAQSKLGESDAERADRFNKIWEHNLWGGVKEESKSGSGSSVAFTHLAVDALKSVINDFDIKTVLDAPCGDLNWLGKADLGKVNYTGADILASAVAQNSKKYPGKTFIQLDYVKDKVPGKYDLIFSRESLQHLYLGDALKALNNFITSGASYLLITHRHIAKGNEQSLVQVSDYFPINLLEPPFNMPTPLRMYADVHPYMYLALYKLPLAQNNVQLP